LYGITVVGVSNVGWITAGPWRGRKVIGCSLAVGPDGKVIQAKPRDVKGTEYSRYLKEKGYSGP